MTLNSYGKTYCFCCYSPLNFEQGITKNTLYFQILRHGSQAQISPSQGLIQLRSRVKISFGFFFSFCFNFFLINEYFNQNIHFLTQRIFVRSPSVEIKVNLFLTLLLPQTDLQLLPQLYNILVKQIMQNIPQISQFMGYFYPIWLPSTIPQPQAQYQPFVNFYCSFIPPAAFPSPNQSSSLQEQVSEKITEPIKIAEKQNDKLETIGAEKLIQFQNKMIENLQVSSEKNVQVDKKPETKKHIPYKIQKSFILSQKIKGGLKSNVRILRKKKLQRLQNCIKDKLRTSDVKKSLKTKKIVHIKQKKEKLELKIQKRQKKDKNQPALKLFQNIAEIPPLISGVRELNQFILAKSEIFRLRQVLKK